MYKPSYSKPNSIDQTPSDTKKKLAKKMGRKIPEVSRREENKVLKSVSKTGHYEMSDKRKKEISDKWEKGKMGKKIEIKAGDPRMPWHNFGAKQDLAKAKEVLKKYKGIDLNK